MNRLAGGQTLCGRAPIATLTYENEIIQLPVRCATRGPNAIDVTDLHRDSSCLTIDTGLTSTANCASRITFIDGEKGELLYRGYPADQLAEHLDFLTVVYLLLHGELPTSEEHASFRKTISRHMMLHEQMARFYTGFRHDAHPMAVMVGVVGALSAFYHDSTDISDPHQRMVASHRMIGKIPTIAAMAYKYSIGQPFVPPQNDLDYTSNLLRMCFAVPCEPYKLNPQIARALNRVFILHADHEQTASTSTVRLAGSSGANPFACIAAGIACLWGPAHGGANEAVLMMLARIGTVECVPGYVKGIRSYTSDLRLAGFGHRIYRHSDPRANAMQQIFHEVVAALEKSDDPILKVAMELERIALQDDVFIENGLRPNIDFYTGLTLYAIGFPVTMFTALLAVARAVGWIAHWMEMIEESGQTIGRPRQLYIGPPRRELSM